ncbi:F-box/kelch-repeat protein [Raphanus sativus]|nr:F-box/kelch-repeat protein [Raphanus sativus]
MDCRSHTVEPLPNILVPMYSRMSCIIDEKIYVMGYCSRYPEKAVLAFNVKTETWEHVMTTPEMNKTLNVSCACAVMADQIYINNCYGSYVYEPKESKLEKDHMLSYRRVVIECVVDDVLYLYYCDPRTNNLRVYDPIKKSYGVVEGFERIVG